MKRIFLTVLILLFSMLQVSCSNLFNSEEQTTTETENINTSKEIRISKVPDIDKDSNQFNPETNMAACTELYSKIVKDECRDAEITSTTGFDVNFKDEKAIQINSILTLNSDKSKKECLKTIQGASAAISSRINNEIPNVCSLRISWLVSDTNAYGNFSYEKIDGLLSLTEVSLEESLDDK